MAKADKELPELTDEESAFEMIEITCEEMDSLAKAFTMISDMCRELNGEDVAPADSSEAHTTEEPPADSELH